MRRRALQRQVARLLARLLVDRSGTAMIELAFCAMLLVTMYAGTYVLNDAVACNRKVARTARAITDMTTRYPAVTATDLTEILTSGAYVLAPFATASSASRVSEIQVIDASHAKVIWSKASNGNDLAKGTVLALPKGLAPAMMIPDPAASPPRAGAYFILGETRYNYTPLFGASIMPAPTLYAKVYMLPRLSDQVPLS
ncbi:TadE/TadG family type IV pilus assembly protein [Novosphingobium sp.]|uniref:TadE/TadG family type IV pilus assembly protein n=1 Tax=Novosphingobium sp. TaxID=1874826 RepID=UPI0038BC1032